MLRYINRREATNNFTRDIDRLVEETKIKDIFRSDYIKVNLHDRDLLVRGYDEGVAVGIEEGYSVGVEEGYNSGIAAGIAKGESRLLATARNLLLENLPIEVVSRCTGLPASAVEQLAAEIHE